MPDYLSQVRESLSRYQTKYLTGSVTALVWVLSDNPASLGADKLNYIMATHENNNENYVDQRWVWNGESWFVGIVFPSIFNNTAIYHGAWDKEQNETFGQKAQHYEIWRQSSVVAESGERISDAGIFTNNRVSPVELFIQALVEYDTHFRDRSPSRFLNDFPGKTTRSAAIPLTLMLWARMVAWYGPETWGSQPQPSDDQMALLRYEETMVEEMESVVMKRGWKITVVLALIPLLTLASLAWRVLLRPDSPIGEGFGMVAVLASVDARDLLLLKGVGYSGKLKGILNVGVSLTGVVDDDDAGSLNTKKRIRIKLGVETLPSTDLVRGEKYS